MGYMKIYKVKNVYSAPNSAKNVVLKINVQNALILVLALLYV